jgi:hypothetical protein
MKPLFEEVQPGDHTNVVYWCRRWGVTQNDLFEAILYTGSLQPDRVHSYLTRNSWIYHPFEVGKKFLYRTYSQMF